MHKQLCYTVAACLGGAKEKTGWNGLRKVMSECVCVCGEWGGGASLVPVISSVCQMELKNNNSIPGAPAVTAADTRQEAPVAPVTAVTQKSLCRGQESNEFQLLLIVPRHDMHASVFI